MMPRMPMIFVGHGSPMNAIEENEYSQTWRKMVEKIPRPKAILSISAHWFTRGTKILEAESPRTIYDMYGFPKKLYEVIYDSPGAPLIAGEARKLISRKTEVDNSWGIDHGTWSVLVHMYPDRKIPVFQISVDAYASPEEHYQIGKDLRSLRNQGVLILGTGNIVHNLRLVDWEMPRQGFDWAVRFDDFILENIQKKDHVKILKHEELGQISRLAVPTPDHFDPLLYVLGAVDEEDRVSVHNRSGELGSLTMTSYLWE